MILLFIVFFLLHELLQSTNFSLAVFNLLSAQKTPNTKMSKQQKQWEIEKKGVRERKKIGSGGIRTHAIEMTGALNQRLRPLGHATTLEKIDYEESDLCAVSS